MSLIIERLSEDQRNALLNAPRGHLEELCGFLDINYDSARAAIHRYRKKVRPLEDEIEWPETPVDDDAPSMEIELLSQTGDAEFGIIDPLDTIKEEPMWIPQSEVLVLSDLHLPHHNAQMLRRALIIRERIFPTVRTLAIVGDTFNLSSMSSFPKGSYEANWIDERPVGGTDLGAL